MEEGDKRGRRKGKEREIGVREQRKEKGNGKYHSHDSFQNSAPMGPAGQCPRWQKTAMRLFRVTTLGKLFTHICLCH